MQAGSGGDNPPDVLPAIISHEAPVDSTISTVLLSLVAPACAPHNPPWHAMTQPPEHAPSAGVVYLLDIDNTLLDGDRMVADLRQHLESEFSIASAQPI